MIFNNLDQLQSQLIHWIKTSNKCAILTHKNPDGDGLAAALAFKLIIEKIFKAPADIILEKDAPDFLDFLQGRMLSTVWDGKTCYDHIFVLDCHEASRTNIDPQIFTHAQCVFFMDHHKKIEQAIDERYHYFIKSDEVCTGIMIHKLFKSHLSAFDQEAQHYYAQAIYTTILNDTDNFLNSNVNAETYQICAELMEYGLVPNNVIMEFLLRKPVEYYKFIGKVLSTLETHCDRQVVFSHSTQQMLEKCGLNNDATSKMMRWFKGIDGAKVQVYFQEYTHDVYRISFRSDDVDVNVIARKFNGGGHTKASGCEILGDLITVKAMVLNELKGILS